MSDIPMLNFAIYLGLSLACWLVGLTLYTLATPYSEIRLIREGNLAASVSLMGTALGLALPLASLAFHAVSVSDYLVWAVVAVLVQLWTWVVVAYMLIPNLRQAIPQGQLGAAVALAGISVSVGLLNAACLSG